MKIKYGKTVPLPYRENAYEVWQSHDGWTWYVLKSYQSDEEKPGARWFCLVESPAMPEGEMGDVYIADIKKDAHRVR